MKSRPILQQVSIKMKTMSLLCLLAIVCSILYGSPISAQVFPQENSVLNYRIIGFSFPAVPKATEYKIEIMPGNVTSSSAFKAELSSAPSDKNRIIYEVPAFGSEYTWRISYNINGTVNQSKLGHFSTGMTASVDTSRSRINIAKKFSDPTQYYLLVDGSGVMYDLNGNPVWYLTTAADALPNDHSRPAPGMPARNRNKQDLKRTKFNTITFINGKTPEEINYNCDVLWQAPENISGSEANTLNLNYHHEFTRASRNSYLTLCNEVTMQTPVSVQPDNNRYAYFPNANETPVSECILFDFNTSGNVLWSWNSSDYLKRSDLAFLPKTSFQSHENAFYFDSSEQSIYFSYPDLSRIIKISYPSGNVTNVYGNTLDPAQAGSNLLATQNQQEIKEKLNSYLFRGQHNCTKSADGNITLFNNNMNDTIPPEVLKLTTNEADGTLTKKWSYPCPVDVPVQNKSNHLLNGGGGSAENFSDSLLLVQMNAPFDKVFIVNNKKELLWSAVLETKLNGDQWHSMHSYRASILTRADLENLIWNSQSVRPFACVHAGAPGRIPK